MQIVPITDSAAWDRALLTLPNPHVLQSWAWGEFKSRYGWQATRLLFQESGRTVAAASVLQRQVSRLPVAACYVPKGPILDWSDAALAARVLQELESLKGFRRAAFIKIDPDIYYPDAAPSFSSRPACAAEMDQTLAARGWRYSEEQIQFRNTVLLDLTHSEEDLMAAMKQKTRYNVRLAARRGVTIRQASTADLDLFYQLYAETSSRDGFIIRPDDYYRDAWGSFMDKDLAHLLLAEVDGEAVAGLMLFVFGPTAWYMYGASSGRHRKHMPNQLLQWEAIRRARAAGCSLYDLWGAPDVLDETDPMWGVYRFKLGLGGELARGLGAWDYATNRLAYRLVALAIPRYRAVLRGLRQSS